MEPMTLAVLLILKLIFGGVCAAIASAKGRSAVGWFFIGFIGDLIGLIIILVLSDLKAEQRRFDEINADRRRLKEQLRQERLKAESFRRYSAARLDSHDRVLGVDTKAMPELSAGGDVVPEVPGLPPADGMPPVPASSGTLWYFEREGAPQGPVPESRLATLLRNGEIASTTLVWTESMSGWTAARDVDPFRGLVA
jgi:hypothetical protein